MQDPAIVYSTRVHQFRLLDQRYAKQLAVLGGVRLLTFGGALWFFIEAFRTGFRSAYFVAGWIALFIFIILVFWALSVMKQRKLAQQLLRININEVEMANGGLSFLEDGARVKPASGYPADLDLFGPRSLFHTINRTGTISGRQHLAQQFASPYYSVEDILQQQSCVEELSGKIEFRQQLLAQGLLLNEENLSQLKAGVPVSNVGKLLNGFWRTMSICWPAGATVLLGWSLWRNDYTWVLLYMIAGLAIIGSLLKKINLLYYHISKRSYLYDQYARCFQLIGREHFTDPLLQKKQQAIKQAAGAFKELSGLTGLFDLRLSILSLFINGLFLLDLICAQAYLRWSRRYQWQLEEWFTVLGEIEAMNSVATFHFNHTEFIFPVPVKEGVLINASGIGHPLMVKGKAVVNDISIGEPECLHLITGSNMSGKSTYLRTLGLNILLAQLGAPVFASKFLFRPLRLLTSFHHIDSLQESTSYFYAELKSLQAIIQSLDEPVPALVLLDEVMRGTNSKDKHDGTALLIKKLLGYRCLVLLATHDTDLGLLADEYPGRMKNFCFESDLTTNGLHFDFKKRDGVAQTRNATYLMKQMGII